MLRAPNRDPPGACGYPVKRFLTPGQRELELLNPFNGKDRLADKRILGP
jgi:hypothetical protein